MEESILSLKYEGSDLPDVKANHRKHSGKALPPNKRWLKTRKRIRRRMLDR